MNTTPLVFILVLCVLAILGVFYERLTRVSPRAEPKPPFDARPCHVKLWMVDNNTIEFDGPGTEMADLLADARGGAAFLIDTKDARILINPRLVIQGRLDVIKPPVEEPAK